MLNAERFRVKRRKRLRHELQEFFNELEEQIPNIQASLECDIWRNPYESNPDSSGLFISDVQADN